MKKLFEKVLVLAVALTSAIASVGCSSKGSTNAGAAGSVAVTDSTVTIGILHSLSGTMAISEVSLRDVLLMGIDEINAAGGVLGRKVIPQIVDPASNPDLFAEKAKELLGKKVPVVFGCWTSVSRKSVLPVFEEYKGLLFYPVQYEGQECSPNIIYTGATPNQQLIPAAQYLMSEEGGSYSKFYLLGTDYVFPRTANTILKTYLIANGIPAENIVEEYTPFHHQDYQTIVSKIKTFAASGDAAVLCTINGDSNVPFYKEFANQGLTAEDCPIMAFSVAEDELRAMDTEFLAGHYAAWNYFESLPGANNEAFVKNFVSYCVGHNLPGGDKRVTDDPICWSYTGLMLWKKAVEKAGTFEVEKVIEALSGLEFDSPAGLVKMHESNHHLAKPAIIGKILRDGQFEIVNSTESLVVPEPFGDYSKKD
ncbi:MAG: urea ABC transporter substrate-binding protein [Bacteroidales bacterium]|nr:urea ABC transporter substrate-binding protein [Bacteroidales bacterium]